MISPRALDRSLHTPPPQFLDRQLRADVVHALRETGYRELERVAVTSDRGCITLSGWVGSYYLKQVAQSAALAVAGVDRLENGLVVR